MARLNIEDSLWSDGRFINFCVKIGDQFKAIGIIVMAWRVAQKYYCPEKKPIPKDALISSNLPIKQLLDADLMIEYGDGYYVRGSQENFEWYFKKYEAAKKAGKKSAEARKKKYGTSLPKNAKNAERKPNDTEPDVRECEQKNGLKNDNNHTEPDVRNLPNERKPDARNSPNESERSYSCSYSYSNTQSKIEVYKSQTKSLPKIAQLWNDYAASNLPRVKTMSQNSRRRKMCEQRWKENPDESYWVKVIEKLNSVPGLVGKNDWGWSANIEFLCKPDCAEKILEGQYDGWGEPKKHPKTEQYSEIAESIQKGEL